MAKTRLLIPFPAAFRKEAGRSASFLLPENIASLKKSQKQKKRRRERIDVHDDNGADDQIRTDYLVITNDVLYLLSYISARNAHYNQWARRMQVFFSISRKKI